MPIATLISASLLPMRKSDLRGIAQLGVRGVVGVTDLVEAMHQTIASRAGVASPSAHGQTAGLTRLVYRVVRGITGAVGSGLDIAFAVTGKDTDKLTPAREAWLAALNGVLGDHLIATNNPLAIPMSLRISGRAFGEVITSSRVSDRVLVLVHGLVMNDLQWTRHSHDHGQAIARELGFTAIYLHYNSGRHISENGREFAGKLEGMVRDWPVPVRELVIVGHSMGGLVARSACHVGAGQTWLKHLSKLVCLGTPHHGAPLERGGRLIDVALGMSPYLAPFARIGRVRSAGITDLRYGNVQDADWQDRDRHSQRSDDRVPTPLPVGVPTYVVAATKAAQAHSLRSTLIGDGLVPVASALGWHRNRALALPVPKDHQLVITKANHWDLLDRSEVFERLVQWLR